MLATHAASTLGTPTRNLEYRTEGTPTSTVSGSASASPRPTGMKSHAHWVLMANSAGSARLGAMFHFPISTPIMVPMTCAMTAPGPSSADSTGIEQINPRMTRPTPFPASGTRSFANQSPNPEP